MMSRQEYRYQLGHMEDYSAFLGNGVMAPQGLTAKAEWMMEFLRTLASTGRLLKRLAEEEEQEREQRLRRAKACVEEREAFKQKVLALFEADRKRLMRKLEDVPSQMAKWLKEIAKIDQAVSIIRGY